MNPYVWTPAQQLVEIAGISLSLSPFDIGVNGSFVGISRDDLERHRVDILSKVHVEVLVSGNIHAPVRHF